MGAWLFGFGSSKPEKTNEDKIERQKTRESTGRNGDEKIPGKYTPFVDEQHDSDEENMDEMEEFGDDG